MASKGFNYWWPRVLVIGFALSLLLPAPKFLSGMGQGQLAVYLARLAWVIGVPLVAGLGFGLIAMASRGRQKRADRLRGDRGNGRQKR